MSRDARALADETADNRLEVARCGALEAARDAFGGRPLPLQIAGAINTLAREAKRIFDLRDLERGRQLPRSVPPAPRGVYTGDSVPDLEPPSVHEADTDPMGLRPDKPTVRRSPPPPPPEALKRRKP